MTEPPLQEGVNGDACGVAMGLRAIACIRALSSAPASAVAEAKRMRGSGNERDRAPPHGAHAHPRRSAKTAGASRQKQDQARSARSTQRARTRKQHAKGHRGGARHAFPCTQLAHRVDRWLVSGLGAQAQACCLQNMYDTPPPRRAAGQTLQELV